MQFTIAAAALMAAGVSAQQYNNSGNAAGAAQASGRGNGLAGANGIGGQAQATAYDTVVVNAYVTTCPGNVASTAFAYNGQTYSATANQVVTVTNCPCTVTAPAGSIPSGALTATAPYNPANTGAVSTNNHAASNTSAGASNTPEAYTGAASKLSGAGLAAVFAIAAYAL